MLVNICLGFACMAGSLLFGCNAGFVLTKTQALVCPRAPSTIYRLPEYGCPPVYTESYDVTGIQLNLAPISTDGSQILGTRVCKEKVTCSILDISRPFGAVYPGPPSRKTTLVSLNEYDAKRGYTSYQTNKTKWVKIGEKSYDKDVCTMILEQDPPIGEATEQIMSVREVYIIGKLELTARSPTVNLNIGGQCDYLEGECQDEEGCWWIWTPHPSIHSWKHPIAQVTGRLLKSKDGHAYLHLTNASGSYHLEPDTKDGTEIWINKQIPTMAFLLSSVRTKRNDNSALQLALDLGRVASARLDWLCDDSISAKLWHSAAWAATPTDVARALFKRGDIHAETCGTGCLVVYVCQPSTFAEVVRTDTCYLHPEIRYRLAGSSEEHIGHLDTQRMLIITQSPEVPCDSGPIRFISEQSDQVTLVYPGGKIEHRATTLAPLGVALDPRLPLLPVQSTVQNWDPNVINPVSHGLSKVRDAFSKWTGAAHLTPGEIDEALASKARDRALHLYPDAGWLGVISSAISWANNLMLIVFGVNLGPAAVRSVVNRFRGANNNEQ